MRWTTIRVRRALTACVSLVVLLSACAGAGEAGKVERTAAPGFPVTVTNCGVTTTYQRPPERVVAMNQHATEVLLALGLGQRMVGTAYLDDKILPQYRDEYRRIPVLSKQYPSYEVLLKAGPDFVYGGFGSAFSAESGRSRQRLSEAGIKTYLNVQDCANAPVTMAQLWREIRTVATIFGVQRRGEELIAKLKADIAATERLLRGADPVSVLVYNGGTKAPRTAGGNGIFNEIIELAGGRNVFEDLRKERAVDVSWEQFVRRKPEVIVLAYYVGGVSAEQKKRFLLSKPALAEVPAIKHSRFVTLPLSSTVLGVRAPRAVPDLARQLHPKRFD